MVALIHNVGADMKAIAQVIGGLMLLLAGLAVMGQTAAKRKQAKGAK